MNISAFDGSVRNDGNEGIELAGRSSRWLGRRRAAVTAWLGRVRRAATETAWGSLAGKGAAYLAGFALLALVGSGRLAWLMPAPGVAASASVPATARAASLVAPAPGIAPASIAATTPKAAEAAPIAEAVAGPVVASAIGAAPAPAPDAGAPVAAGDGVTADGKIVLNRAGEDDLRKLPGIGPTRAKGILALRARLGRFARVEDLMRVKGIGRRSLARLRPLVVLD